MEDGKFVTLDHPVIESLKKDLEQYLITEESFEVGGELRIIDNEFKSFFNERRTQLVSDFKILNIRVDYENVVYEDTKDGNAKDENTKDENAKDKYVNDENAKDGNAKDEEKKKKPSICPLKAKFTVKSSKMQIQKLKQELITNYSSLSEKFEKKQITNQNVVNRLKQFKDYDYKNYFSRFNCEIIDSEGGEVYLFCVQDSSSYEDFIKSIDKNFRLGFKPISNFENNGDLGYDKGFFSRAKIEREEEKICISEILEKDIHELVKCMSDSDRTKLITDLENDKQVKVELTPDQTVIYGDQCFDAKASLWNRFKKELYFKTQIEMPKEWENVEAHYQGEKVQVFSLDKVKHKDEYKLVENQFMINNGYGGKVISIERIQNIDLFENYYFARRRVLDKYNHAFFGLTENNLNTDLRFRDEKLCFHGTCDTDPKIIYNSSEGVDRRYTTTGYYGMGSYFAIYSNYSAHANYVHCIRDNIYQMFLCRVMPGISCTTDKMEDQNFSIPGMNNATGKRFDSSTNDHKDSNKQMYVVFSNDQSYPQWLITFTM